MTAQADVTTVVAEIRTALEMLDAVIQVRLEERKGGIEHRPLSIDDGDDGIPPLERYEGIGPLAAAIGMAGLSAAEALILVAAIAPLIDERFDAAYAALTDRDGVTGLTGEVARTLVARSLGARLDAAALLGPHGALRASGLVRLDPPDSLAGRLTPEPALAAWTLGLPAPEQRATAEFPARPLTTVHSLTDVVLPARTRSRLTDLQHRIAWRERVVEDWGFGRHHDNTAGLVALFHGPPGTGKTMTAGAVAAAAGLPAYVIDLSALVSKYIGETEKALANVFDRAAHERCVLVFDEADAVFGSRTEVTDSHDRYANQEVSYLLTRIESHPGVVILTTNLRGNIDDAFQRRIHLAVEFAPPGPAERALIWEQALPPELPVAGDLGLASLADRYVLTGAQIRDAIVDAAYAAAAANDVVTEELLVTAVRRQYDKAGRTVPS
ncbi:ATP-binding protein [Demequina sp.]|uniref:ATP-binding protein n=1 Tax=Demequina sp. TaxID=2050685 RepID=UPI003D0C0D33